MEPGPSPATPLRPSATLERLLAHLAARVEDTGLPEPGTPLGDLTREFLRESWSGAREGVLARTGRIRVRAEPSPAPLSFRFEIDRPYKRRGGSAGAVVLAPGPVRGRVRYRPDLFTAPPGEPCALVLLDREQGFFHPNCRDGILCLGDLPGPFPLADLLEHVYRVVSYQNVGTGEPLDAEAADWFLRDPTALDGLRPVEPLY